ncbi:DNA/RNA non-specific endonuclease, partial [Sutcliffiella cohnii]
QVERDLANRSSRFNRLQSPNLMKRGKWWESYFSSDKKTRNRLINLLFPWLQLTFQRHFGLLYPIGPALSFNKWINPNSPREVTFSDVEKQAIVDYLKRVDNGEVSSNMEQYAGMTSSYEGYIGENNIFGQPLGGNAPQNAETISTYADFLPFFGNLKAASEVYLGYDPLTGRELEDWERGVAAAAILGGGAARLGGKVAPKVVDKVGDLGKGDLSKKVTYGDQYTKVDGKKTLKPNIEYSTKEGYHYKTDSEGRITNVEATLQLGKADRNNYAQRTVGREDRLPNDDGGHLIASIFKGSGEIDNLVPMNAALNRKEYKVLETSWKKALQAGKEVTVKVKPIYEANSSRPTEFKVSYTIDGKKYSDRLTNYLGGKLDGN